MLRVRRFQIGNDQETRAQAAGSVGQCEIFLVGLHGQDQAFLRHGQIFFLEMAGIYHRPFDQRVDFIEQAFRHQHLVITGLCQQCGTNFFLARFNTGDSLAIRFQPRCIVFCMRQRQFAAGQKAVAQCGAAGLQTEYADRHDSITVQRNQPVHRTHELHGGAIGALVAHQFRNRQLGDALFQRCLQAALQG